MITIKIAGAAGQGVKSAGKLFARFAVRSGYCVYTFVEYPSIIKGGHNVMQVNIGSDRMRAPSNTTDILIALNQEGIDFHLDELHQNSAVVFDGESKMDVSKIPQGVKLCPLPLKMFSKQAGNNLLLVNTVALGGVAGLLGGNLDILNKFISEEYSDKGEEVVKADVMAAGLGYKFATEEYTDHVSNSLDPRQKQTERQTIMINGNEAAAMGAISAGLQFAAIYPMSPISNILHELVKYEEKYNFVYKQPEDEISAINMAIGASFAGARSFTATSGGGFALMAEAYGLAGIAEIPLVIVEGMRGGPATGLPTWSSQGDLRFVLHAHQDDFPRIVLTPGDPKEVFEMTMQAFNLADKYQTPVVILIDKNICENDQCFEMFDTSSYKVDRGNFTTEKVDNYLRYKLAEDGISPRSVPGSGNFFIANSDEHDEEGYSSEEIKNRNDQMQKRMNKLITCANEDMPEPKLYGPQEADLTFVSWGSNKGSILQAMKEFTNVNYLHITWANPFPTEVVRRVLENSRYVVNVECNYTAQMGNLIREKTGIKIEDNLLKYDGRPFYVQEITNKINSVLKGGNL